MKKIIAICLLLFILSTSALSVIAADKVASPTAYSAPVIIEDTPSQETIVEEEEDKENPGYDLNGDKLYTEEAYDTEGQLKEDATYELAVDYKYRAEICLYENDEIIRRVRVSEMADISIENAANAEAVSYPTDKEAEDFREQYEAYVDYVSSQQLLIAYRELKNNQLNAVVPNLDEVAKELDEEYNSTVFVVSQIFDLELLDDTNREISNTDLLDLDEHYLRVRFQLTLGKDEQIPTVIHKNIETGVWEVVPSSDVFYDAENEILTVHFDHLCPVAFLSVVPENLNSGGIIVLELDEIYYVALIGILCALLLIAILILILVIVSKRGGGNPPPTTIICPFTTSKESSSNAGPSLPQDLGAPAMVIVTDELKKEETVQIPVSEDTPSAILADAAPSAILADDDDDDDGTETATQEGTKLNPLFADIDGRILIRYRNSYEARLIQAPAKTKKYYNDLKNYLLRIKRSKCKKSWGSETFSRGRVKLVRALIKGKTLVLTFPLDPKQFVDTKYNIKDVSSEEREVDYPSLMKITSDRALRYAKELIDGIVLQNGLVINKDYVAQDYAPAFEEQSALIERGLIKVIRTGDLHDSDAVVELADIKEVIAGNEG